MTQKSLRHITETIEQFHKRYNLVEVWTTTKEIVGRHDTVFDLPGFAGKSDDDCKIMLLAMLVQNALTVKNSQRKEAAENATDDIHSLKTITNAAEARKYLVTYLSGKVLNQLRSKESALIKKLQDGAMDLVVDEVLRAPNAFIAAAMIKMNAMSIGRGDFKKAVMQLGEQKSVIPDLGRKLVMLKTGFFLHRDLLDIDKPMKISVRLKATDESDALKLFSDKKAKLQPDQHMLSHKHVFRVWCNHVFKGNGSAMTQQQLENIFPEYAHKLQLYMHCCDETGKIVKDQDFYKKYKEQPHFHSKRGGIKKDKVQK